MSIRVSIVEDDKQIRNALEIMLGSFDGIEHVSSHGSAEELLDSFIHLKPDVVIMDIGLPGITGIECVRKIKPAAPNTQFMMCSVFEEDEKIFDALCAGATGYLVKNSPPRKFQEAIHDIYTGGSPMSAQIARKVVASFQQRTQPSKEFDHLSQREKQILQLLSNGLRYKEIAAQLFISQETVRTHIRNIYEKLQVDSRTEALNKVFGKR